MKGRLALTGVLLLFLVPFSFGCANVEPVLSSTPTPSASPTPMPDAFTAEVTAVPMPTDALGKEIQSDAHYEQYLSFGDLRVYEYDDGTFLDGVCVNAFPMTLDGGIDIVYYTPEGKVCGKGTLHTAAGGTALASGTNAVYGEIDTDIDVRMMDFKLEITRVFQPVEDAPEE